jgi:pyrroline-5-carboxylate reductase
MAAKLTIGFLGAGKMATALARGFVHAEIIFPRELIASDPYETARRHFASEVGARVTADNAEATAFASVLILATKPDQVAGVTLARLAEALPAGARIIRVMPNTPALIGAGASAFASGPHATPADAALAGKLLSAVGLALPVKESLLDAVTGLSGSGPAYVYQFIEALSDGGVAAGLPRDLATRLAAQTVMGAAKMILETGQHPGVLKDQVTSPAGTTIEGLHELEKGGLRGAVMNAVRAATERSRKLGQS